MRKFQVHIFNDTGLEFFGGKMFCVDRGLILFIIQLFLCFAIEVSVYNASKNLA